MKSARSERASRVVEAMTGVGLFSQGLAEVGQPNGSQALAVVAFVGGALILGGMIARRRFAARFPHFHAMVSFFEGLTCAFVGVAAAQRGTHYIQYAWLLAALGFFVVTVIQVRRTHQAAIPPMVAAEK